MRFVFFRCGIIGSLDQCPDRRAGVVLSLESGIVNDCPMQTMVAERWGVQYAASG